MSTKSTKDSMTMARDCIKALKAVLLLAVAVPGAVNAKNPPSSIQDAVLTARVLDSEARIYSDRDPLSDALLAGSTGDLYPVRSKLGSWYEIELPDGRTGWIVGQHVAVKPARALLGTRGEIAGALTGTLVGGTATVLLLSGTIALADPFDGLFERVHGSGTVSQTAVLFALGASATSLVLTPAAAAFGAYTAGERNQPGGNVLISWVYAAAGGILGAGLGIGLDALASHVTNGNAGIFSSLGGLVGTTAGAVIGYENSRPPYARQYRWTQHLSPPTIALAADNSAGGQLSPVMQLNLVSLHF